MSERINPETLHAYFDGELPAEEAARVERSLPDAPAEAKELEELTRLREVFAELPRPTAPPQLADRVCERIQQLPVPTSSDSSQSGLVDDSGDVKPAGFSSESAPPASPATPLFARLPRWRVAITAAASLAALLLIALVVQPWLLRNNVFSTAQSDSSAADIGSNVGSEADSEADAGSLESRSSASAEKLARSGLGGGGGALEAERFGAESPMGESPGQEGGRADRASAAQPAGGLALPPPGGASRPAARAGRGGGRNVAEERMRSAVPSPGRRGGIAASSAAAEDPAQDRTQSGIAAASSQPNNRPLPTRPAPEAMPSNSIAERARTMADRDGLPAAAGDLAMESRGRAAEGDTQPQTPRTNFAQPLTLGAAGGEQSEPRALQGQVALQTELYAYVEPTTLQSLAQRYATPELNERQLGEDAESTGRRFADDEAALQATLTEFGFVPLPRLAATEQAAEAENEEQESIQETLSERSFDERLSLNSRAARRVKKSEGESTEVVVYQLEASSTDANRLLRVLALEQQEELSLFFQAELVHPGQGEIADEVEASEREETKVIAEPSLGPANIVFVPIQRQALEQSVQAAGGRRQGDSAKPLPSGDSAATGAQTERGDTETLGGQPSTQQQAGNEDPAPSFYWRRGKLIEQPRSSLGLQQREGSGLRREQASTETQAVDAEAESHAASGETPDRQRRDDTSRPDNTSRLKNTSRPDNIGQIYRVPQFAGEGRVRLVLLLRKSITSAEADSRRVTKPAAAQPPTPQSPAPQSPATESGQR